MDQFLPELKWRVGHVEYNENIIMLLLSEFSYSGDVVLISSL